MQLFVKEKLPLLFGGRECSVVTSVKPTIMVSHLRRIAQKTYMLIGFKIKTKNNEYHTTPDKVN